MITYTYLSLLTRSLFKSLFPILCFFIFVNLSAVSFAQEKLNLVAPTVIPNTNRLMKSPGFWISRDPNIDREILKPPEIQLFNKKLMDQGYVKDLLSFNVSDHSSVRWQIEKELVKFKQGDFYNKSGQRPGRGFWEPLRKNVNLEGFKEFNVRYAFVAAYVDQRLLPTNDLLTTDRFDVDFDELQNSSLDIGTPVLVLHESRDGQWVFTQTASSCGWVRKDHLVFFAVDKFSKILLNRDVVIINAKAAIYLDPQRRQFYDYVRMGARFPVANAGGEGALAILIPDIKAKDFRTVYVNSGEAHVGLLTYTPRTVIEQAFKLLNEPYGWGGMNGEQDCSAFLVQVFGTVGLELPRNSAEQGQAGIPLGSFELKDIEKKIKILQSAQPGVTIAQMKGHIVLFLGLVNGRPYAIHEAYAYRERFKDQDVPRVLNRVVVSDLYLGEGTEKGCLLSRISSIRELR